MTEPIVLPLLEVLPCISGINFFQLLQCPNEQVKLLTEVVYNVCSNFIPNDLKKIRSCKAPWVTKAIKTFIRKKDRAYKSFVKMVSQRKGILRFKT